MKHYSIICFLLFILCGCQSDVEVIDQTLRKELSRPQSSVSPAEALETCLGLLGKEYGASRSFSLQEVECIPVVGTKYTTRSAIASDTVAYVFNFPDEEGFAIAAAKSCVFPILAFSDNGKFDLDMSWQNSILSII